MDTERFLTESKMARFVRLPARVVVGRGTHSLNDVRSIAEARVLELGNAEGAVELEVSGVVLARGRIVRKGKRLFFKVAELSSDREGGER